MSANLLCGLHRVSIASSPRASCPPFPPSFQPIILAFPYAPQEQANTRCSASNNIRDVLDSEYAGLSFDEAAANARLTVRFQHDSLNIHSTDCQTFKYVCGRCDDLPEGQHFEPEVEDVGRAA